MAKLVVVCKTSETEAHKIAAMLVSHRSNPVIFDRTDILRGYPDPVERIRVFVPAEEYDAAARILAESDCRNEVKAAPALKRANGVFLLIMILLTLLALIAALAVIARRWAP